MLACELPRNIHSEKSAIKPLALRLPQPTAQWIPSLAYYLEAHIDRVLDNQSQNGGRLEVMGPFSQSNGFPYPISLGPMKFGTLL
jgi:hypothetical protein